MLWEHYVYKRGTEVPDIWEQLFSGDKAIRVLYIAGRGFDVRAQVALKEFVASVKASGVKVESAELLLIGLPGYELSDALERITEENGRALEAIFSELGTTHPIDVPKTLEEEDVSATHMLRLTLDAAIARIKNHSDVVLEVSSLPRVTYLALMTSILNKLLPEKSSQALAANGVNFHVLVAEDANLDAQIVAEDPSTDPMMVPGFASTVHVEAVQEWPMVWFPILGEKRVNQLLQLVKSNNVIQDEAEVCPVLPHPSKNPRRADQLILEYRESLFDKGRASTENVLYVHESNPFEAYRQLLQAMQRYRESMSVLGGCRLVVTPLGSKLVTIGAGLACFEMRPRDLNANYGIAIPYAEPNRYSVDPSALQKSKPELSLLLLTGEAYSDSN